MSPKWTQKGSNSCLKIYSKMEPENDPKMTPKWSQKSIGAGWLLELFLGSFSCLWPMAKRAQHGSQSAFTWLKKAPGGLQEGSKTAKMAPRGPMMAPGGPLRGPRRAPRGCQDGQDGAKRAHDGSKMAPGRLEEGPRQPKMAPKGSQDGLKWLR